MTGMSQARRLPLAAHHRGREANQTGRSTTRERRAVMDTLKRLVTRTRVEGLVIMLVAVGYLWEAGNVPEFYQLPDAPGPTTFPYLLGGVFAAVGLWLLVSPLALLRRPAAASGVPAPAAPPPDASPTTPTGWLRRLLAAWHFYAMWAAVLAYLWFMPDVGFPVATFLLLAVFTWLLGETRAWVCVGLALVATAVIYLSFRHGLNVRLPLGVVETLFK